MTPTQALLLAGALSVLFGVITWQTKSYVARKRSENLTNITTEAIEDLSSAEYVYNLLEIKHKFMRDTMRYQEHPLYDTMIVSFNVAYGKNMKELEIN